MAAKDSNDKSKTSKTARVMNLLSKKQDSAPPSEEGGESASLPPIISSLAPDAAVAGQIKDALTDLLEQELGEQIPTAAPEPEPPVQEASPAPAPAEVPPESEEPAAPTEPPQPVQDEEEEFVPLEEIPAAAAEPPVQEAPPAPQAEPVSAPAPQPEPEPVSAPAPQPEAPASAPQPISTSHEHALEQHQSGGYINVMQVLVEEKAEKYIKLFGLCECERCRADVKALTLNRLPSKYVVMDQGEMIPKLTFYESKYSSDITTQLLHACKVVMETPHHSRQAH